MCGRYAKLTKDSRILDRLGIDQACRNPPISRTSANVPPGVFDSIALASREEPGTLALVAAYWGFTPSWAESPSRAQINARVETAHTKPYWRKAFHRRRCVIPASWWYEWQRADSGKQCYAIRPKEADDGFFFAGVWSLAQSLPTGHQAAQNRTYAILTTTADEYLGAIHHRMPIALTDEGAKAWLAEGTDTEELHERLRIGRYDAYIAAAASNRIGDVANDAFDLVPESISGFPPSNWQPFGELPPSV